MIYETSKGFINLVKTYDGLGIVEYLVLDAMTGEKLGKAFDLRNGEWSGYEERDAWQGPAIYGDFAEIAEFMGSIARAVADAG